MSIIRSYNGIRINPPYEIGGASVTSTTSETILDSVLIPANTFKLYDVFGIEARVRKSNTNGNMTMRIRINTSNSIVGSILIAQSATIFANLFGLDITRRLCIKNLTSDTEALNSASTNISSDIGMSTQGFSNHSINWASNQYVIVTIQLANGSDVARLRHLYIDCPEATDAIV